MCNQIGHQMGVQTSHQDVRPNRSPDEIDQISDEHGQQMSNLTGYQIWDQMWDPNGSQM